MIVSFEQLKACFTEVLSHLAEELEKHNNKKNNREIEIRVLVHQSHAGAVIGRSGTKIKELREETGSLLKVFQECCPNSTDRVLLVSATQEKLPDVIVTIVEFIRDVPIKGVTKNYDASNYDARAAFGYGGYIFDKTAPRVADFRGPMSAKSQVGPYGSAPPPVYGEYGRNGNAPSFYNTGSLRAAPPSYAGAPPMAGANYMGDNTPVTTTQVTIPNELGGTIIGRGGERINLIRNESGAKIDVGAPYGSNERIITITGNAHQIQSAQYLLQQTVRSSEAGRRYLQQQQAR